MNKKIYFFISRVFIPLVGGCSPPCRKGAPLGVFHIIKFGL